ncbi:MAG TPA: dihydrofolate reductase [Gammaproteobacteria bacterium]|nr:dihydrofolate reductase [Gammaproteobacteria bacterium]
MMMAMDRNRLIGAEGGLPWHLPDELQYFKSVTLGKPVIMGRKTHEDIGRPLPGRTNIVVTRQPNWHSQGVHAVHSLDDALATAAQYLDETQEAMIIGGAALCRAAMDVTEKLYLTEIDHAFEGDVWLDAFEPEHWEEVSARQVAPTDRQPFAYTCRVLRRKRV